LAYLREVAERFRKEYGFKVSSPSLVRILNEAGYTHKAMEQRALEIQFKDVVRFMEELMALNDGQGPLLEQLLFLDEMSTDNRAMLRKRGWFLRGHKPVVHTLFRRGTRISILAFLGVDGIVENFETKGTFDRTAFFDCCKRLLESGKVDKGPGRHSVWILDGAAIHMDPAIIEWIRLQGTCLQKKKKKNDNEKKNLCVFLFFRSYCHFPPSLLPVL
jgi:hypothetical protein